MKAWIVSIAALLSVFANAQDQSACLGPRQPVSTSSCSSGDVGRNIKVHVATLYTDDGDASGRYTPAGSGGGYASLGSRVTPETMADTVGRVEQRQYRSCDIGLEII